MWYKVQMLWKPSPVFDNAEVKAGEVSVDEGLKGTYDPASIKLTVGICHLQKQTSMAFTLHNVSQQLKNSVGSCRERTLMLNSRNMCSIYWSM